VPVCATGRDAAVMLAVPPGGCACEGVLARTG